MSEKRYTKDFVEHYGCMYYKYCRYWPLELSYQDFSRKCYSKQISNDSLIIEEGLILNRSMLIEQEVSVSVYIHEAGQLYRHNANMEVTRMIPSDGEQYWYQHDVVILKYFIRGQMAKYHAIKILQMKINTFEKDL